MTIHEDIFNRNFIHRCIKNYFTSFYLTSHPDADIQSSCSFVYTFGFESNTIQLCSISWYYKMAVYLFLYELLDTGIIYYNIPIKNG